MYHLSEYPHILRTKYSNKTIIKYFHLKSSTWKKLNGEQVAESCLGVAKAFAHVNIEVGTRIGIYSQNLSKVLLTEIGAYMMRAVVVPLYATNSPEQVQFVVEDAEINILFVGEQFQYNNAYRVLKSSPTLKRIVVFDEDVILDPEDNTTMFFDEFIRRGDSMQNQTIAQKTASEALASDLAVIMYTSGTSGRSKGVMLHHHNFMVQIYEHQNRYKFINHRETVMCFLPLSHIFEKAWCYFCLGQGCTIAFLRDPKLILEALPIIKPTMMCNVPRFWEKVYIGVHDKMNDFPLPLYKIMKHAIKIGKKYNIEYKRIGKRAPLWVWAIFKIYNKLIFNKVKKAIGLQNGKFFPCAGAPLNKNIHEFLRSINIPIVIGYGLTETTATVSSYQSEHFDMDSVGTVLNTIDIRIDPETNEIQLKGPTITSGYYNNEEANKEAFTTDGYFKTGDTGRLDGRTLYFTERIKDLFKTANGKYISPQMIESLLTANPIIEQAAVIADGYKFVSALIYPNWEIIKKEATARKVDVNRSKEELADDHEIHRIISSHIEIALGGLAQFEKIKRFSLITEPFSESNGELTSTMKLKRKVINNHYSDTITKMYSY